MGDREEQQPEGRAVGAHRAVLRLGKRTGLAVGRADVDVLVERGLLTVAGEFNGWPTYRLDEIDVVPVDVLHGVVVERTEWLDSSVDERTAATIVGVQQRDLRQWAAVRGVVAGRFGRYARVDVAALEKARVAGRWPVNDVARWVDRVLSPGHAVLLDTETADLGGAVCEIAVIDAVIGEVLLDTLVNPGMPIAETARGVHGIGDADVAGAPRWPAVLPALLRATEGRLIVAYNSGYDGRVVRADCERYGLDAGHLGDERNWHCLMTRRTEFLGADRPPRLGGPHRALADCRVALGLLRGLAKSVRSREPQPGQVVGGRAMTVNSVPKGSVITAMRP